MITVEQLRNTARFGSSRSDQAILEIADRLEQLEREVKELKTSHHRNQRSIGTAEEEWLKSL